MKKGKIIFVIVSLAVILAVLGVSTYAYLTSQGQNAKSTEAEIITDTVDTLTFNIDGTLEIEANETNFLSENTNVSAVSRGKIALNASSLSNSLKRYGMYLEIKYNDFEYVSGTSPELIVSVKNPSNGTVDLSDNLNYVDVYSNKNVRVTGYDITTAQGIIPVVNNYEISSDGTLTEHTWEVTITLLNMNRNQNANIGKKISVDVVLFRDESLNHCMVNSLLSDCIISRYANEDFSAVRIYHHNADLENGANDNSYRFNSSNTNYVCFGTDDSNHLYKKGWCSSNNLYRIIGVFKEKIKNDDTGIWEETGNYQVKLIRNGGSYNAAWNRSGNTNDWTQSPLNLNTLNGASSSFLGSFNDSWKAKIANHSWIIGGVDSTGFSTKNVQQLYQEEIANYLNDSTSQYEAKIGLPYLTDMLYDSLAKTWTNMVYSGNSASVYSRRYGIHVNTVVHSITKDLSSETKTIMLYPSTDYVYIQKDYSVDTYAYSTPTFYLNSNITYQGGAGTANDPIRIG